MNSIVEWTVTTFMPNTPSATATVVLAHALEVGETFQLDRRPDFGFYVVTGNQPFTVGPPVVVSNGVAYVLTINSPGIALPVGGIWYIRTFKSGNPNNDNLRPPVILFDYSLVQPFTAAGRDLAKIVLDNKPLFDLLLQAVDPRLEFQTSVFGAEWNAADATPGVLVKPYMLTQAYEELPRTFITTATYAVAGIIRTSDAENEAEAIGQLMEGLRLALNQTAYETYTLSTGVLVNGGMSLTHQFADEFLNDVWATKTSFLWQWQFLRGTA